MEFLAGRGRRLPQKPGVAGILSLVMLVTVAAAMHAGPVKIERPESGTALVKDPGAPGGRGLAVRIQEKPGAVTMGFQWADARPGLYRLSLPLHLHTRPGFKAALLKMNVFFGAGEKEWLRS